MSFPRAPRNQGDLSFNSSPSGRKGSTRSKCDAKPSLDLRKISQDRIRMEIQGSKTENDLRRELGMGLNVLGEKQKSDKDYVSYLAKYHDANYHQTPTKVTVDAEDAVNTGDRGSLREKIKALKIQTGTSPTSSDKVKEMDSPFLFCPFGNSTVDISEASTNLADRLVDSGPLTEGQTSIDIRDKNLVQNKQDVMDDADRMKSAREKVKDKIMSEFFPQRKVSDVNSQTLSRARRRSSINAIIGVFSSIMLAII